jgi:signal transduction histidine kinase
MDRTAEPGAGPSGLGGGARPSADREDILEGIARREAILDAVTFAAERFLRGDPLEVAVPEVLRRIGNASGAGRVVLIERVDRPDGAHMRLRGEWDAPGVRPLVAAPDPDGYRYFPRWERDLGAGRLVAGRIRDMPDDERAALELDAVGSIVVTPIVVSGRWWGHVGYDDRRVERIWSGPEVDALRAAAGIIGAAIQQLESAATIDRRNAILGAVADTAPLFLMTHRWVDVLPILLSSLRAATQARSSWAYELHADRQAHLIAERLGPGERESTEFGRVVQVKLRSFERMSAGDVIQNEYLAEDSVAEAAAYATLGIRSWLAVPILIGGRMWGGVGLDSHDDRAWTEGEVVALKVAAAAIAAAVERDQTEDRLRHLAKMDAVGRLAGGLAHDFGNHLAIVLGHARFLRDDAPTDDMRSDAQAVLDAAGRGSDLVRDLLTFSRRRAGEIQAVDLNDRIGRVERILRGVLGPGIALTVEGGAALPPVWADPGELENVVVNLVVNARDAMPDGGRITIVTGRQELADGPRVVLTVADTGSGMDEATRARIFEPFFSTKPEGAGTGLGLATAYGSVTGWGGTIDVTSEPGVGTTFRLLLRPAEAA